MSEWWVPLISAGAALSGVWLGDLRSRGREREARFALLRQEALVQLYAWTINAGQDISTYMQTGAVEASELAPDVLARIFIYIDADLARTAATARDAVRELSADIDLEERLERSRTASRAIGAATAIVQIKVRELDSAPATRLRWLVQSVLRPTLSMDDPAWSDLSRSERFRRRVGALRRELRRRKRRGPTDERGIGPGLR
jgi:hypothetical protein